MSKTVFILGAGASVHAGAPVMADFLDEAESLWKKNEVNESRKHFELVFKGLSALRRAHSNSQVDLQNVESVFAAFEMAKLLGKLDRLTDDEMIELPTAMRTVIVQTLEQKVRFPVTEGKIGAPVHYAHLAADVCKLV